MLLFPGRVVAKTKADAVKMIEEQIRSRGFTPAGDIKPYPCRVQPDTETTWFEFYVHVNQGAQEG